MNWKQRLLDWDTPEIEAFYVLDLLVHRKSVLLVSWRGKHISFVRFPQLKKSYDGSSRGVVLSFPELYDSIIVEFRNGFHKSVEFCRLKRIEMSDESANEIIRTFKSPVGFGVIPFKPAIAIGAFGTGFANLQVTIPEAIPTNNQVGLRLSAFEYPADK